MVSRDEVMGNNGSNLSVLDVIFGVVVVRNDLGMTVG